MQITKLIIFFENCEEVSIDGECINYLSLQNIKKSVRASFKGHGYMTESAENFAVWITPKGNDIYVPFGKHGFGLDSTIFERLKQANDITGVTIRYQEKIGEQEDTYYVPWEGTDYSNNLQSLVVGPKGDMFIVVSSDYTADKFFEKFLGEKKNEEEVQKD